MEVICRGYKNCKCSNWCNHSKPHEFIEKSINYCYHQEDAMESLEKNCWCSDKDIRRYKLEKLNEI